jgi:hypothetical protein
MRIRRGRSIQEAGLWKVNENNCKMMTQIKENITV